jgi:hypothetical protein
MSDKRSDEEYSPEETALRMKNAIRRALNTPPKPHKEMVGKGRRAAAKNKSRIKTVR